MVTEIIKKETDYMIDIHDHTNIWLDAESQLRKLRRKESCDFYLSNYCKDLFLVYCCIALSGVNIFSFSSALSSTMVYHLVILRMILISKECK